MPALVAAMQAVDKGVNNRIACAINLGIVYAIACIESGVAPKPYAAVDGGN